MTIRVKGLTRQISHVTTRQKLQIIVAHFSYRADNVFSVILLRIRLICK